MKVNNSKNYKFPNALHLQFVLEVLGLTMKFEQIRLKISMLFDIFNLCVEKEDSCFKIIRKSNLSRIKKALDKARDTIMVGIIHLIKAGIRHFNPEIREAAMRLKIVIDTYNKPVPVIDLSYNAETATINKLIQELNTNHADDMKTVDITSWVDELQLKNNDFDALAKDYHEETSGKPLLRLIDLRKDTDKAYHNMVTFINALALVDKETSYDQFITELNTIIKLYNDALAKHLGRIQSKNDQDDLDDEDTE